MVETVRAMAAARDDRALDDVWRLLGGAGGERGVSARGQKAELIVALVHDMCGKGGLYSAERGALEQLANTVGVEPSRYPAVDPLEDAIVEALSKRLEDEISRMSEEERRKYVEDMVRRMSDEERIRLIGQVLEGYDSMTPEEQRVFLAQLAAEFELDPPELEKAIAGGAATLLPLLIAKHAGFASFLWTTKVMYIAAGSVGLKLPFTAYMLKNTALGWLLGPVGLMVTTAMSLGWFGARAWRRKERFRKLVQLVVYMSIWREGQAS